MFFRGLRAVLGPFMLLWERLSRPKAVGREAGEQDEVDRACQQLTLYQFRTCPFCIKVRQECHRLSLRIRRLDAQHDQGVRQQLLHGGGEIKVPCLRIIDEAGNTRWLYESGQIVAYLRGRFPVS
jgi:glutaredoxin